MKNASPIACVKKAFVAAATLLLIGGVQARAQTAGEDLPLYNDALEQDIRAVYKLAQENCLKGAAAMTLVIDGNLPNGKPGPGIDVIELGRLMTMTKNFDRLCPVFAKDSPLYTDPLKPSGRSSFSMNEITSQERHP